MIKGDIIPVQSEIDKFLIDFWMIATRSILEKTIFEIDARLDADKEQQYPLFDSDAHEKLAKSLEKFRYELASDILKEQKEVITALVQKINKQRAKKLEEKPIFDPKEVTEDSKKQLIDLKKALAKVKRAHKKAA